MSEHDVDRAGPSAEWFRSELDACRAEIERLRAEVVALKPAESMALTVALAQVSADGEATKNTATVCVLALARLRGLVGWDDEFGYLPLESAEASGG